MTTTRSQGAAGDALSEGAHIEKLSAVMERILERLPPQTERSERFKVPKFDGQTKVEHFIHQFTDVAHASNWNGQAGTIHLREALQGTALDCGKYDTTELIMGALRSKFGMTKREARAKLASLSKEYKTKLQDHASLVENLVDTAYPDMPWQFLSDMALDAFMSSLGNRELQRHLLAVPTPNLDAAVRAGNDYLQIPPTANRYHVRTLEPRRF